jgi:ABC-type polysaccharide/polyol phosphate export permease
MDVILILAITLLILFIGALFYAKNRQPGFEEFSISI